MAEKDNWEHRSEGMVCVTCMWHQEKDYPIGRCKRRAPTMNGFPVVYNTDWCGDHKLDEKSIVRKAE